MSLPTYIHYSNSVHHFKAQFLPWVNPNDQGHLKRKSQYPGYNVCVCVRACVRAWVGG